MIIGRTFSVVTTLRRSAAAVEDRSFSPGSASGARRYAPPT